MKELIINNYKLNYEKLLQIFETINSKKLKKVLKKLKKKIN